MNKYFIIVVIALIALVSTNFTKEITPPLNKNIDYANTKTAYFAGGCFWGVEYHLEKQKGVKDVLSGFMGGTVKNPDYYEVIRGNTGHLETVKVIYDPKEISFEKLTKLFFEIHDMEQKDGQGPDIGSQYLSAVFYHNEEEKTVAQDVINILTTKGYDVATSLLEVTPFYLAEGYHQNYYARTGKLPYCHSYKKIFD